MFSPSDAFPFARQAAAEAPQQAASPSGPSNHVSDHENEQPIGRHSRDAKSALQKKRDNHGTQRPHQQGKNMSFEDTAHVEMESDSVCSNGHNDECMHHMQGSQSFQEPYSAEEISRARAEAQHSRIAVGQMRVDESMRSTGSQDVAQHIAQLRKNMENSSKARSSWAQKKAPKGGFAERVQGLLGTHAEDASSVSGTHRSHTHVGDACQHKHDHHHGHGGVCKGHGAHTCSLIVCVYMCGLFVCGATTCDCQ